MALKNPSEVVVLNTIQAAAADIVFSGGKVQLNDGSKNLLTEAIRLSDGISYSKTAFAAGTASVKEYDLAAVSLTANTTYTLSVSIEGRVDFASGGGQEANELFVIRTYIISSGATAPTANSLRDEFIARINSDQFAGVTAASGGAGVLELTLDDVNFGDFDVTAPAGTAESITTPYVAPSGTPDIVGAVAPNLVSPAGEYTTYVVNVDRRRRSNIVNGGKVLYPEFYYIFAEENAANFAAFETALDDILDGSHTPVSDYLGI